MLLVDRPPSGPVDPDALIEEARRRTRKRRRRIALVVLMVAAAGLAIALDGAGGGKPGARDSSHGRGASAYVRGSVSSVSVASGAFQLFVEPSLGGSDSLCFDVNYSGGSYGTCGAGPYPGPGAPAVSPGPPGDGALGIGPPRANSDNGPLLLVTAPGVSAVRVGDLGTVPVQHQAGLPPGDGVVAFTAKLKKAAFVAAPGVPVADGHIVLPRLKRGSPRLRRLQVELSATPTITLTALDPDGRAIPVDLARYQLGPGVPRATTRAGCAVASDSSRLVAQTTYSTPPVRPAGELPASALTSCLSELLRYEGKRFEVAILLGGKHPSQRAPAIWDATPLAGHPGVVTVYSATGTPDNALVARRVGNVWLAVRPWVGFPGWPTLVQRLTVLAALRITRLNLP
jgi:hypothetical protein